MQEAVSTTNPVKAEVPPAMKQSIPRNGLNGSASAPVLGDKVAVKATEEPESSASGLKADEPEARIEAKSETGKRAQPASLPLEQLEDVDLKCYEDAGLLSPEQAHKLMEKRHDSYEYFIALKQELVPESLMRKYSQEYFSGIALSQYSALSEMQGDVPEATLKQVAKDINSHLSLLKESKSISALSLEKIGRLAKDGRIFHLSNLYNLAHQYHLNELSLSSIDFESMVQQGVLEEEPELDLANDAYDISHYYEEHKMVDFSKLCAKDELQNYADFLKSISCLLPQQHKYSDWIVEMVDNGRSTYNTRTRDLRCSITVNDKCYALRFPNFETGDSAASDQRQRGDRYRLLVQLYNKVLFELGEQNRLRLVTDRVPVDNISARIPMQYATVVKEPVGFESPLIGQLTASESDVWSISEKEVLLYIENLEKGGLLDRYDEQFISYIKSIAPEYKFVSAQDIFWLFDDLVAPVVPRESGDYQCILEELARTSNSEIKYGAIELKAQDDQYDILSFAVNEQQFASRTLSNQIDISFIVALNNHLAEQNLGQYYLWTWERSSWEQINLIYLHDTTIDTCSLPSPDAFIPITQEMAEMYC